MKVSLFARLTLFGTIALSANLFAETPATSPPAETPSALELGKGETLVFLGDSITHQCLYTQYVEDFYYTRYPDLELHFHNAGVSGDRAGDALARFEDDVASFKPSVVTLLLGMNDGAYSDFDTETFEIYSSKMSEILDRIDAIGARPVVMSPTMFDHHQLSLQMRDPDFRFRERTFSEQYNALLAFYSGWLREQTGKRRFAFVDQWGPMNTIVFSERRHEQDFTLVPDAIHPAPAGQFLMAFELLNQVTPSRRSVSSINIVPSKNGFRAGGTGGTITELEVSEDKDRITFTHLANSLPWVVPAGAYSTDEKWDAIPAAPLGVELTNAGHKLSNERLRIAGLAPGTYEIKIDGQSIGQFSHLLLGSKIELQGNEKTPQYQQALDVAKLNRERNDLAVRPLRNTWGSIKGIRRKTEGDPAAFKEKSESSMAKIADLLDLAKEYELRIHRAATPQARRYEVTRIE